MVKVKICGITNIRDARAAVSFGADALGFVFYQKSPRYILPAAAGRIIMALPPFVSIVGVFVNPPIKELENTLQLCRLDYVQFHGEESPAFCRKVRKKFNVRVIKAFRIKDKDSLKSIRRYKVDAFLLDAFQKNTPGGTGTAFDWRLMKHAGIDHDRLMVAGGLHPGNVRQMVRLTNPGAVDTSSGVERVPGKKDHGKLKKFIMLAKQKI